MTGPPSSGSRVMPRDIAELKALGERQPDLADAAQLQIGLIEAVRRVQGRLSTPWLDLNTEALQQKLASGVALLDFQMIAFEWNDVRLLVRQITDILRRHDAVDAGTAAALHALGRGDRLPELMRAWFEGRPTEDVEMLDEVLLWAARPYLQRTAEVLQQRVGFDTWKGRTCPVCRAEPEFGVITSSGERNLVCGRCHSRWVFAGIACAFCGNDDKMQLKTMATPDGVYRVLLCRACGRHLKSLDARRATRPFLPYADPIVTLPLDAAVMNRDR